MKCHRKTLVRSFFRDKYTYVHVSFAAVERHFRLAKRYGWYACTRVK